MSQKLLICTDLDRTLIPNGPEPESPDARDYFQQLCDYEDVELAYVSGRDRSLVIDAINDYDLPQPDYVIADVGSTLYQVHGLNRWEKWAEWEEEIGSDWNGYSHQALSQQLSDWPGLSLQEPEKQQPFKLSFYVELEADHRPLLEGIGKRLINLGVRANLIWSIDDLAGVGLLDLLPERAGKYQAIEFLRQHLGYEIADTLFSGDSGNDLDVLTSHLPSVLVANARPEVLSEAQRMVDENGLSNAFYPAKGGFMGMNGNYSAGILEGLAHYHPEYASRLMNQNSR
ncbi:MAG: HAD-IIB family hydrolase [Candidatus Thiodiazotropha sp. 6PLUC9]